MRGTHEENQKDVEGIEKVAETIPANGYPCHAYNGTHYRAPPLLHGVSELGERFLPLCSSFDVAGLWNTNKVVGMAGRFWDHND
jgi:hypothetical protein